MSETFQIIISVLFLICVFILTRYFVSWKMRRAAHGIITILKEKKAFDPETAITLPFEKKELIKVGLRDFRPKALTALVTTGIVERTEDGRYYLRDTSVPVDE